MWCIPTSRRARVFCCPVSKRLKHSQEAFTLIEVLVVVAIMALLLSLLVPALKRARDQAKITVCLTNLHDTGVALHQYTVEYDPYYPLVPYMGSSIYYDNPGADDNLFVLWWKKLCPNPGTFTCPSTNHKIRAPRKVLLEYQSTGIRYNIFCDPDSRQARNDWEFHGQLVEEVVQDPFYTAIPVNGYGTSYEYMGWAGTPRVKTKLDWYPFRRQKEVNGQPLKLGLIKFPAGHILMKDADEGSSQGNVVGAPEGKATNNLPEPWDNHGSALTNVLFADGHAMSRWCKGYEILN